ncbi:MAG: extracellular solute-binding protein, partial [Lentisphaerota bacterium]
KTVIHVTVFSLPDPNTTDTFSRANLETVKLFKKRFPHIFAEKYAAKYMADPGKYGKHNWNNVEIQLHAFSGIQVQGVESDLLAIAGGMAPDLLYINFRKSDNYIRNGFLYPLDEYFETLPKAEQDLRIHPRLWEVVKRKGPDGKSHYWTMPYGSALGKLLMYRKDIFRKNNIPLPTIDWTWNELLEAAKKISDPGKGLYGMMSFCNGYQFTTFLWSAGGDVMLYDEPSDEWKCTFNTPQVTEALDFFIRLNTEKWIGKDGAVNRGYTSQVNPDWSSNFEKWNRGEIGMMLGYIDEKSYASINPELVGMIPAPIGPGGHRASELNSTMYGIFSQITEPAVRDAVWEYMLFTDSREATVFRTKLLVEGGMANFVKPKFLEMAGYPELVKYAPKGYDEIYRIAFETGKPEPYGKNSNFAYQMLDIPLQKAMALSLSDKLPEDRTERLKVMQKILDESCARANEVMIGKISPEDKVKRRAVAALVLLLIVITFGFVIRNIFKLFTPPQTSGKVVTWGFRKYWVSYLMLFPAVASILVWSYTPIVQGTSMAFYNYKIIGKSVFIGLDNFGDILFDSFWWNAVWNSIRYCFTMLSLTF